MTYCKATHENIKEKIASVERLRKDLEIAIGKIPEDIDVKSQDALGKFGAELGYYEKLVPPSIVPAQEVTTAESTQKKLIPQVCYPFIELKKEPASTEILTQNLGVPVTTFVSNFLRNNKINFTVETDTQPAGQESFTKFSCVKEIKQEEPSSGGVKNEPFSITIICADNCEDIYVFTDSILHYPIEKKDLALYQPDIVDVSDSVDTAKALQEVTSKKEYELAFQDFKQRFGLDPKSQEGRDILTYAIFHSVYCVDEALFKEFTTKYGLLIHSEDVIAVPDFIDEKKNTHSAAELFNQGLLIHNLNADESLRDDIIKYNAEELSKMISQLAQNPDDEPSIVEFNHTNKEGQNTRTNNFQVKLSYLPLGYLPIYACCFANATDRKQLTALCDLNDKFASRLTKNFDFQAWPEVNKSLLKNLLNKAFDEAEPRLLEFVEKHKIGFHGCDKDCIVDITSCAFSALIASTESNNSIVRSQYLKLYDYLRTKCSIAELFSFDGKGVSEYNFKRMGQILDYCRDLLNEDRPLLAKLFAKNPIVPVKKNDNFDDLLTKFRNAGRGDALTDVIALKLAEYYEVAQTFPEKNPDYGLQMVDLNIEQMGVKKSDPLVQIYRKGLQERYDSSKKIPDDALFEQLLNVFRKKLFPDNSKKIDINFLSKNISDMVIHEISDKFFQLFDSEFEVAFKRKLEQITEKHENF